MQANHPIEDSGDQGPGRGKRKSIISVDPSVLAANQRTMDATQLMSETN
jgi:hypothetical protein